MLTGSIVASLALVMLARSQSSALVSPAIEMLGAAHTRLLYETSVRGRIDADS
jgi:hypothetical protein